MIFKHGDRVRIRNPLSEYTGCRGTVVQDAEDQPEGVHALGHFVAIDGENGRTRPFLIGDLEPLRVARVRPATGAPSERETSGGRSGAGSPQSGD